MRASLALHVGTPPQSEEEIAPVRDALRLLDPLLDLRWNAQAFVARYAGFDAKGNPSQPKYEGRWEVVRFDTDRLHQERDFAVICTVAEIDRTRGYPIMLDKGPYAPIGFWLVEYMQLWDRAQGRFAEEMMKRAWADHERAGEPDDMRAENQEALEKVYRTHGGEYWVGGAQGKADPITERALWPARVPSRTPTP